MFRMIQGIVRERKSWSVPKTAVEVSNEDTGSV
jgi:hypothetical protein